MALPRQLKEIAFGAGLNTKGDDRAQPEQLLDIGVNVEFDDVGDLRCRFPFDHVRTALVGGGTLANARKLAMLGNELVCFTATGLYSWIPALAAWEYRGDHLAVATDEETVFATPGDQSFADRAELNGHVVYCWESVVGVAGNLYIAVRDKATGAVVQGATKITPSILFNYTRPRLIALNNCVLLFWVSLSTAFVPTTTVMAAKITVAPYVYTAAGAPVATFSGGLTTTNYDVCRIPGQDRCYVAAADTVAGVGGGYTITSVDSAFAGAQTNGTLFSSPSNNPIAIAVSPDAAFCTVINSPSNRIYADVWNVTAAAVPLTVAQTQIRLDAGLAGLMAQVTAAYRLTQDGGHYRCYVFWSQDEVDIDVVRLSSAWIDSTAATGASAAFVYALGIGARAFAHDSHVYLLATFAGLSFSIGDPSGTFSELQNTYYLYRDDAFLVAKAVWGEAGGFQPKGWLPNVVAPSANAMVTMGGIRRIVPVGSGTAPAIAKNYAGRAPREITFTFDDNRARRCVQFGETLYVLGGIVLQYDGTQLVELGTCTYPWIVSATTSGAAGAIPAGGYSYRCTDRWANAKGETDRSTSGTVANENTAGALKIFVSMPNLYVTRKTDVALEVWRTKVNPPAGAPFFLVTSQDPSAVGDNGYATSDPTSAVLAVITDNLTDAQLAVLPANPENGAVLANIEPPPASIAYADSQRIYLAGIPGYPNTVYYSKFRQPGQVAAFNDGLTFDVPTDGGAITAIDYLDGTLVVWCETATYAYAGGGLDDTGGGGNFQLARILSKDLGSVGPEACTYFDDGFLVKTNKGWFLLDRSLNYQYVGSGPAKYDAETVSAMTVLTGRHQIRVMTSGRILVFDTLVKQWAETSVADGVDMILWAGTPAYLTATGVRAELATWDGYDGSDASLTQIDIQLGWVKFGSTQARAIVDYVQLLGELRSSCAIRKRIAKDYEFSAPGVWNYNTDITVSPVPGTIGSALQVRQAPAKKRCESLKPRFTITHIDGVSPLAGPCVRLTSIVMPFAVEPTPYSAVSAAQKA